MSNGLYVPDREGPNWAALKQAEERRETGRGEQVKEKIRKQEMIDKIKMAVINARLKGTIQPRAGAETGELGGLEDIEKSYEVLGKKPRFKIGKSDIEELGTTLSGEAIEKYPGETMEEKPWWTKLAGAVTPWATPTEKATTGLEEKRGEFVETGMKPFLQQHKAQFLGRPGGANAETDVQSLIEEYQTTTDPTRLQELEQLLTNMGVSFE